MDVARQGSVFRRPTPDVGPVVALLVGVARTDGVEHVLGGVRVGRARGRAVAFEVVDQHAAAGPQLAKVYHAAAALEQQQHVEIVKEDGRWLVDGTQDGLAGVGQLAQQTHDVGCGQRVEPGRGLVEEDEQLRLARQLDGDGQALALLLVEARAVRANDGARNVAHLEQVEHLLAVPVLVLAGHVPRLPQRRREA